MKTLEARGLATALSIATARLRPENTGWRVRIDTRADVVHVQWVDLLHDAVITTIVAPSDRIVADVKAFVETKSATMHTWTVEYVGGSDV